MYRPPAFVIDDPRTLDAFVDAHPFALLASATEAAPQMTHAPVMRAANGDLVCHLARPNPHCDLLASGAPTTVVFTGPHGYVSPRWYAAAHAVPTWNYTAVHVQVRPGEIEDRDALRAGMDAMLDRFEPDPDIREIVDDATIGGMLRGVRGFRLEVLARQGAFKLSQNKTRADQDGVIANLASGDGGDALLAAFMRDLRAGADLDAAP